MNFNVSTTHITSNAIISGMGRELKRARMNVYVCPQFFGTPEKQTMNTYARWGGPHPDEDMEMFKMCGQFEIDHQALLTKQGVFFDEIATCLRRFCHGFKLDCQQFTFFSVRESEIIMTVAEVTKQIKSGKVPDISQVFVEGDALHRLKFHGESSGFFEVPICTAASSLFLRFPTDSKLEAGQVDKPGDQATDATTAMNCPGELNTFLMQDGGRKPAVETSVSEKRPRPMQLDSPSKKRRAGSVEAQGSESSQPLKRERRLAILERLVVMMNHKLTTVINRVGPAPWNSSAVAPPPVSQLAMPRQVQSGQLYYPPQIPHPLNVVQNAVDPIFSPSAVDAQTLHSRTEVKSGPCASVYFDESFEGNIKSIDATRTDVPVTAENMHAVVDNVSGSDNVYSPDSTAAVGSGVECASDDDSDWVSGGAFAIKDPEAGVGMGTTLVKSRR